jgi:hypothetical protein
MGALLGLVAGVIKRPTKLAAAMEADRQLGLADLLGTAVAIGKAAVHGQNAHATFEKTVAALAEARCAAMSPSTVLVNKLGARSWGGIALAVGLVSALGLMGGQERANARAASVATAKSWVEIEQERANAARMNSTPDMRVQPRGTGGDDADPVKAAVNADAANVKAAGDNTGAGNTGEGTGTGSAKTNVGGNAEKTTAVGGNGEAGKNGVAGGGGAGTANGGGDGKSGAGTVGEKGRPTPVWQSAEWASAKDAAQEAIRSGKVPVGHQGIVRDYFER